MCPDITPWRLRWAMLENKEAYYCTVFKYACIALQKKKILHIEQVGADIIL